MAVHVRGLIKRYSRTTVLDGVDLDARRGEVVALLGPNGAGKTTTVRILATLVRPDGGTVQVLGDDVVRRAAAVRRRISLTGQYAAVDTALTARENLRLAAQLAHLPRARVRPRAEELLAGFDLVDAADRRTSTYSGGMRRRLDLAVGLVAHPELVILDEPTTGLDPRSRRAMWEVIRTVVAEGASLLLTTQYLEEADRLADRVVLLDAGRVVAEGTADALKARVGQARLELVLGSRSDAAIVARALAPARASEPASSPTGWVLEVPTAPSVEACSALLSRIAGSGVEPLRWELRTPTLDDAFLALTGRATSSPDARSPDTDKSTDAARVEVPP